ncbi:hypothetical protein AB5N19_05045 [Seiridium cardinale]
MGEGVPLVSSALKYTSQTRARARVLVVGVSSKSGQSVLSNSPGLKLAQSLADSGRVDGMFADPLVKQSSIPLIPHIGDECWDREMLETFDIIIVAVKQVGMDFTILQGSRGPRIRMRCA